MQSYWAELIKHVCFISRFRLDKLVRLVIRFSSNKCNRYNDENICLQKENKITRLPLGEFQSVSSALTSE